MKAVTLIVAACLASVLGVRAVAGADLGRVVGFGMMGPLVAVAVSWWLVERAHRRDPRAVAPLMMAAFLVKAVFFGAYVTIMLKVVGVDPVPFVVSFTVYFVALYGVEAVLLQRLFRGNAAPPSS